MKRDLFMQNGNGNGKKEFRWIVVWILVLGAFILWRWWDIHRGKEADKPVATYNRLMFVAAGCDKYKETNGVFPDSLDVLHQFRADSNDPCSKDAWGQNVIVVPYEASRGYGKIISYGRDGKPGGVGKDRDLEVRFPVQENHDWNKKMADDTEIARFLD
ncbi:MAG TPA: type II secretion system protein GspG [Verrucomicrobiae bacterium]|nr:type II secretion system protein GspG [Verrucomicrobiae bacterium]